MGDIRESQECCTKDNLRIVCLLIRHIRQFQRNQRLRFVYRCFWRYACDLLDGVYTGLHQNTYGSTDDVFTLRDVPGMSCAFQPTDVISFVLDRYACHQPTAVISTLV